MVLQLGNLAEIRAADGALYFAAVVILTMLSAMSFDPRLIAEGKNPLQIDTKGERKISFREFAESQNRFRQLKRGFAAEYDAVIAEGERVVNQRYLYYKMLAEMDYTNFVGEIAKAAE